MERTTFRCHIPLPFREQEQVAVKTMVVDPAEVIDPTKPPFAVNLPGSKPYHGHPMLEETRTNGWCLGAVTDPFEADCDEGCTIGDGFVEAPSGERAGLVWTVHAEPRFGVLIPPDADRWGVFHFTLLKPIANMEDLRQAFQSMLGPLEQLYARYHPANPDNRPHPRADSAPKPTRRPSPPPSSN